MSTARIILDTSGSLWQFKRDEIESNVNVNLNLLSLKYKSDLIVGLEADGTVKNVKIAVPLK